MNEREFWNKKAESGLGEITPDQWGDEELAASVVDSFFLDIETDLLKEMTVMEFGCGEGRLMKHIAPRVKKYVGVDISNVVLDRAKELAVKESLLNTGFRCCDLLEKMPFSKETFDVIVSHTVFMHNKFSKIKKYLEKFFFLLKTDGKIVCEFSSSPDTGRTERCFSVLEKEDAFWEGRWFPEDLVSDALFSAGFSVVVLPRGPHFHWEAIK